MRGAVTWKEQSRGEMRQIGDIGGRPICVTVSYAEINGVRAAFVEGCSQVVDYKMVDEWIEQEMPQTASHRADTMNWRNALAGLKADQLPDVEDPAPMSNPIRIVPMGDSAYAITGLAQCDVQVHVGYRVPTDATETHNYHANIDGLPNYVARGETELGAAEAMCGRLIADLTKPPLSAGEPSGPEALLVYLADCERVRREETTWRYDSPARIESVAREEAYRAAAQIIHAARVLTDPTEAQRRFWDRHAEGLRVTDPCSSDDKPSL